MILPENLKFLRISFSLIFLFEDEINGDEIIQKMNKMLNDLDEQIDSLLNSSKNFSDNKEEMSTKFYNGYFIVISFKVKMPKTYEHFFAKKENVNDILIEKILKKIDCLVICLNYYSRNIKICNQNKETSEKFVIHLLKLKIFQIFFTCLKMKSIQN
jgi:hypothetical protein